MNIITAQCSISTDVIAKNIPNVTNKGLSKGTTFGVPSSSSVQVISIKAFEEIDIAVPKKINKIDVDISMVPHDVLTLSRFDMLVLKSRSSALCFWYYWIRRLFVAMNWLQNYQQFGHKGPWKYQSHHCRASSKWICSRVFHLSGR